ncbi:MAG: cyclic nucleotide-binding domain-containing protein [Bacteroidetes bacterium]|nr:cyclic nucleotide-binding domain-containing protein [Bacteroidota bacterium]
MKSNANFLETLLKFGVSENSAKAFIAAFEPVEFAKKEIITAQGTVEHYFYFVVEGIQKSVFTKHGKEHVVAFSYPGQTTGVPDSLMNQMPSPVDLVALTNSSLLKLHYNKLQEFIHTNQEITKLMMQGYEFLITGLIQRQYELQAFNMKERFEIFYGRSKHLINHIPRKDIASYLNMDATNLSKLMAQLD